MRVGCAFYTQSGTIHPGANIELNADFIDNAGGQFWFVLLDPKIWIPGNFP